MLLWSSDLGASVNGWDGPTDGLAVDDVAIGLEVGGSDGAAARTIAGPRVGLEVDGIDSILLGAELNAGDSELYGAVEGIGVDGVLEGISEDMNEGSAVVDRLPYV